MTTKQQVPTDATPYPDKQVGDMLYKANIGEDSYLAEFIIVAKTREGHCWCLLLNKVDTGQRDYQTEPRWACELHCTVSDAIRASIDSDTKYANKLLAYAKNAETLIDCSVLVVQNELHRFDNSRKEEHANSTPDCTASPG